MINRQELFYVCSDTYIQVHFRLDYSMEANTMNPWEQSDLGPYCLQYRVPKKINRQESMSSAFYICSASYTQVHLRLDFSWN